MADSFKPTKAMQDAAARGLELRHRYGRGGLSNAQASDEGVGSGVQRAQNIKNGKSLSLETVSRMRAFFERHEKNYQPDKKESDGGPTAGTIAWLLWGGNSGRTWADKILRQEGKLEKADIKDITCEVFKVDETLGILFGFAIVCLIDGQEYFDTQGDHIPEFEMLKATAEFMRGSRPAKIQHKGTQQGQIVFGFPLTAEIASALGVETKKTGFVIGMKPDSQKVVEAFQQGELTGFSIGGRANNELIEDET